MEKYSIAYIDKHDQIQQVLYSSDSLISCILEWDDLNYTLNDNLWFFQDSQEMDIYEINRIYSWLYYWCLVDTHHVNGYN